jgi:SCY1-like protein 2
LDRFRHPRILTLTHSVEETHDTLAFASEPVLGSLANVIGSLDDRLPQNISNDVRAYQFLDFEIRYGILQLAEALNSLHTSCKIIHRNLCPQSIIVTRKGTWKLFGFEFIEKCNDADYLVSLDQLFTSQRSFPCVSVAGLCIFGFRRNKEKLMLF